MGLGIDLATQNLFCTGNDQGRHLFAQLLLGTDSFLFDFSLGTSNDAVGFDLGVNLGFFDQLSSALFSIADQFGGLFLALTKSIRGALSGQFEILLAAFDSSQTIRDL